MSGEQYETLDDLLAAGKAGKFVGRWMETMTLHPVMLRACAAYLARAAVYYPPSFSILREDSKAAYPGISDDGREKLANAHIEAIRRYGKRARTGGVEPSVKATAQTILEATPGMLTWWCETLAPKDA